MTQMIYYLLCLSSFIVAIDGKLSTCPRFPDPKNGRMICDQVLGKYCSPECHPGFEPSHRQAWAYICNLNTKKWATYPENYPLPWPDCIPESSRASRTSGNRSHAITNEDMLKNLNVVSNFINNVMDEPARSLINAKQTDTEKRTPNAEKRTQAPTTQLDKTSTSPTTENVPHNHDNKNETKSKLEATNNTVTDNGKEMGTPDDNPKTNSNINKNSKLNNNSNPNESVEKTQNPDSTNAQKKSLLTSDEHEYQLLESAKDEGEDVTTFGFDVKELQKNNGKGEGNITVKSLVNKPLRPVFSADDLDLLRHIVSNFNIKRSDLSPHSSSSLWSRMVQLTSHRKSPLLAGKRRMLPRKVLARKDLDVARLIMNDINRARAYSLRHHMRHPMKFIQLLKKTRAKFENPFSRQYVFNGATFVPVPVDGSAPSSYLNSDKGGGLSAGARYRWNGATFVPVNPEDLPIVSEETDIKLDDKSKLKINDNPLLPLDLPEEKAADPGYDQYDPYQSYPGIAPDPNSKYVFNGATFVPLQEGKGKEVSYINSDAGGGLTPEGKYKWNGATFVTNDEGDDATPGGQTSAFSVNNEIQRILEMWNNHNAVVNEEEKKQKEAEASAKAVAPAPEPESLPEPPPPPPPAEESNSEPEPKSSAPTQASPTYNPFLPTDAPESQTQKPTISDSSEKRTEKLFYWDGARYEPVESVRNLPIGTMRYKKVKGSYEQVDIVNESTYAKDVKNVPDYTTQLQAIRQQELDQQQQQQPAMSSAELNPPPPIPIPDYPESSEKNSGVQPSRPPKYVWNGATFIPQEASSQPFLLPDRTPALYEWNGYRFLPTLDNGSSKFLYTWNGVDFVPYIKPVYPPPPPAMYAAPPSPPPLLPTVAYPTPTKDDPGRSASSVFDAKVQFPKINERMDLNPASKSEEPSPTTPKTTTPTTTSTTTTTTELMPPRNPYLPTTSRKEEEGPDDKSKFKDQLAESKPDDSILLPPVNPYLPTDKAKDSNDEIAKLEEKQESTSSYLLPPPNPYLPGVTNETNESGHRAPIPTTPMMHTRVPPVPKVEKAESFRDEENLEGVIKHDPDLKNEIEDLTRKYENMNGNTPVDKALLEMESPPSIEKVLDNDLKQKAPEQFNALKDIDEADRLLQREEEKQRYYGPTARVKEKDEEDDEATKQLKAALDKIEEKKREKNKPTSTLIDSLSTNDKGKLEKSLQDDMEKLSSNTIGKSSSEESSIKSYKDSGLNVEDLRELLEITKLAEKQATAKKFGLTRPNLAYMHPMKVLRKKSVRDFLRYLIKRHALTKALTKLNLHDYPKDSKPPPMTAFRGMAPHASSYHPVTQNSVRKLVSEWNKSYKDITKKQKGALPKFHG